MNKSLKTEKDIENIFEKALNQSHFYGFIIIDEHGYIKGKHGATDKIFTCTQILNSIHIHDLLPEYKFQDILCTQENEFEIDIKNHAQKNILVESLTLDNRNLLLIIRDITARKEAEKRLQQAEKMETIGLITSNITHNFNNLLTIIMGALRSIKKETKDIILSDNLCKNLETIETATNRSTHQIRQLMMFARPQEPQTSKINLHDFIEDNMQMIAMSMHNGIQFTNLIPHHIWPVAIDKAIFETALLNLTVNASDAMLGSGSLVISANNVVLDQGYTFLSPDIKQGNYVCMNIADTGQGISPEIIPHIFEPFFTTKEEGKGTGLGLSMVYGSIRKMGGYIHVYSEPGFGTTFKIYLPAIIKNTNITPAQKFKNKSVLIIDDQKLMQDLSMRMFQKIGFNTSIATSKSAAFEILENKETKIDLIFMDLFLEGQENGAKIAQDILSKWPQIKIIYASGYPRETVDKNYAPPVNAPMMIKPFDLNTLQKTVGQVFAGIA